MTLKEVMAAYDKLYATTYIKQAALKMTILKYSKIVNIGVNLALNHY